jgi:hypothetical protein
MKLLNYKNFESKFLKNVTEIWPDESDLTYGELKSDISELMMSLTDEDFEYKLVANNWRKEPSDDELVRWVSIELTKHSKWVISDIDKDFFPIIMYLKSFNIFPIGNESITKDYVSNKKSIYFKDDMDIYRNRISRVAGTSNTYSYDIQFQNYNIS